MNTAKNIILSDWFFDSQLSFASNLSQAFCRQISFLTGVITPRIAMDQDIDQAFQLGTLLCIISCISAYLILSLDR
jgi:hypothetical protein